MKKITIWETPVEGKGAFCRIVIDRDKHSASLKISTYGAKPAVLFEADIKCDEVRIHHNDIHIADIHTDKHSFLSIRGVIKVEKVIIETNLPLLINKIVAVRIYCVDEMLDYEDLEEKR